MATPPDACDNVSSAPVATRTGDGRRAAAGTRWSLARYRVELRPCHLVFETAPGQDARAISTHEEIPRLLDGAPRRLA